MLKTTFFLTAVLVSSILTNAHEIPGEINRDLPSFSRIVASPRINLILSEGDQESIRLVYHRVDPSNINIEVKGKTLRVYLDDSKYTEKLERVSRYEKRSVYADVSITAYVTYKNLRHLEIRGEQELTCSSPLTSEKFTLKAYGRNEINLLSLKTRYLKTQLYGENTMKISGGKAEFQKYKLYGENKINTEDLKSFSATATIFGESKLRLSTQDELKINAFGESQVSYNGDAHISRGLIFGRTEIRKLN